MFRCSIYIILKTTFEQTARTKMYTSRKRKFSASSEDVAEYPNSILDKKLQSEDPTSGPENDPFANYIGFDKIIQAGISDRIS